MIELKPANSGGYRAYYQGQLLGEIIFQDFRHYLWPSGSLLSGYLLDCLAFKLKELDAEYMSRLTGPSTERIGSEYVQSTDKSPPF